MEEGKDAIHDLEVEIARLRAEVAELECRAERHCRILEELPDGYFETDLNGRITYCNRALAEAHGYTQEEYLTLTHNQLFPSPADRQKLEEVFRHVYETGAPLPAIEQKTACKDGSIKTCEISLALVRDRDGAPTGFCGICRDITPRKQLEEEYLRYREFIENVDDGCWEVDLRGRYKFINKAASERHGYRPEELVGTGFEVLLRPENLPWVRKIFNEVYRTGEPRIIGDYEVIGRDGQISYLDVSVTLIRDAEGKPLGFRGVSRDMTERKRLENKIIQSQKFEAITTLAAGIAHTFNNILMGVQGNVALMLLDMDAHYEHYQRLRSVEDQIKVATDLTRQLLAYARVTPVEMKPLQINAVLDRTATLVARTRKEVKVRRNFAPNLKPVKADAGQMEQVFMNLLINAWQAMTSGGTISLKTENVYLPLEEAKKHEVEEGQYVKITVTDTGRGMDEGTMKRIFDSFFTTKEVGSGTGLGLPAAYGIIKSHRGAIDVKSSPGRGTTFVIYLPAEGEKQAERKEAAGAEGLGRSPKILIVDDEAMIAQVTSAMLNALGYETVIARSRQEAIHRYEKEKAQISLIIMDMTMPDGGGLAAIGEIKAVNPEAKIVIMSGYALGAEEQELLNRGIVSSFLQKPFRLDDLASVVRNVFGQ